MAGTYTEIIEIVAPGSALAGSRVDITVKIKNKYASTIGIMVGGALEYGVAPRPSINFPTNWANVPGGTVQSFTGSFTMPSKGVAVYIYSYYYSDGMWYPDDEKQKSVTLGQEFKGSLSRKELEYDETRGRIPVY